MVFQFSIQPKEIKDQVKQLYFNMEKDSPDHGLLLFLKNDDNILDNYLAIRS